MARTQLFQGDELEDGLCRPTQGWHQVRRLFEKGMGRAAKEIRPGCVKEPYLQVTRLLRQ
jgi:hypothetical protein